jgi:hypothetical protein
MVVFGRTPVISALSAADMVFFCLPLNCYLCFREPRGTTDSSVTSQLAPLPRVCGEVAGNRVGMRPRGAVTRVA